LKKLDAEHSSRTQLLLVQEEKPVGKDSEKRRKNKQELMGHLQTVVPGKHKITRGATKC